MARSYLPHGFRFHPTDEELLVHYLKKKVAGKVRHDTIIGEIDIYKFEPTDLPDLAVLRSRDPEWFFYNPQDKKYHGSRTNRTTKAGYWKATGKDRRVAAGSCSGMKKTLIYYVGRAPHGERTDWVMHEYRLDEEVERNLNSPKTFVLCRVRRKSGLGPRNGEQYGAPVLEEEVERDDLSEVVDGTAVSPSGLLDSAVESAVQESQIVNTVIDGTRTEGRKDVMSFLQDFVAFDEQEQHLAQEDDFVTKGLLSLLENPSDFTPAGSTYETAPMNTSDINSSNLLSGLLEPADNEAIMLEDVLYMINGVEALPKHSSGIQEHPHSHTPCANDWQRVGYLELADLDSPCDESSTMESADFERLLNELEKDMEFQSSPSFIQDQLQMHQSLPSSGYREGTRDLQQLGDSRMNNELEVPLDSSEGISVLGSIDGRLLELDGVVPSGFLLGLNDGAVGNNLVPSLALNHSHSNESYEQPEVQLREIDNQLESRTALTGEHINSSSFSLVLPNHCSNTPASVAPGPSAPSSFRTVIPGLLEKVNTLPASAAELPSEQNRSDFSEIESCVCSSVNKKLGESRLTYNGSLGIIGTQLNLTVQLTPSRDDKQAARISQLEIRLTVSSIFVGDLHSVQHSKDATECLSRYLFLLATVALIAF